MSKQTALGIALILLLAAYPLISIGATQGIPALWWIGVAAVIIGGLIAPISRFVFDGGGEEQGEEES